MLGAFGLFFVAAACGSDNGGATRTPTSSGSEPRVVQERRADRQGEGWEISELTTPAVRGEAALVRAQVQPNARCSLLIRTAIGTALSADGIGDATADDDGNIEWNFVVPDNAFVGTATAHVDCPGGGTLTRSMRIS